MKQLLDAIKNYWQIITVAVAVVSAGAIFPFKLSAMEQRQDKFEQVQTSLYEQTTMIGKWVEKQEYEKELLESAPPGWKWDATKREYVEK